MIHGTTFQAVLVMILSTPFSGGHKENSAGQPVPFRHPVHLELELECQACHGGTPDQTVGLPGAQVCLTCHDSDPKDPNSSKLRELQGTQQSVPWIKGQRIAEYVFFEHANHLRARLECFDCHTRAASGEYPVTPETVAMTGCVDCHLSRSASIACGLCHLQTIR